VAGIGSLFGRIGARAAGGGLALAALVFALPAHAGPNWIGGQHQTVSVRVPAGALPPGPAVASFERSSELQHSVRFMVPPNETVTVRLLNDRSYRRDEDPQGPMIQVVSDAGPVWKQRIDVQQDGQFYKPRDAAVFVGDAARLAELTAQVNDLRGIPARLKKSVDEITLVPRQKALALGCRSLARAALVVVADPAPDLLPDLRACAARGARILLLGGSVKEPLLPRPGRLSRVGLGWLGYSPSIDVTAARFAVELGDNERAQPEEAVFSSLPDSIAPHTADPPRKVPARSILLMLWLYAALIAPVGYVIGRRLRTTWLAWGWIPAVAVVATLVLAVATGKGAAVEPEMRRTEASWTDPSGLGLSFTHLSIRTEDTESFTVASEWRDGDVGGLARSHRFGSPFRPPAGPIRVDEDAIAGSIRFSGLGVGRRDRMPISWVQTVEAVAVPRLERRGTEYWLRNPAAGTLSKGRVFLRRAAGRVSAIGPGDAGKVDFTPDSIPQADDVTDVMSKKWLSEFAPRDGVLIAAEYVESVLGRVDVEPKLASQSISLRVVIGPLDDEPERGEPP
jgi:hypothetical protein